ncbi:LLM class flavin-dependent oxidoreductase [Ktedonosporobacter rubrisoli]|uniref:LLM class flavin-dependent oxidoreductase n=1 Tax=Ktedonosporobacter rubrisoli TaxID=2509675 RepID=A0A4P6JPD9_KTERU|nr:LLM class flavin-dependent oxidoreductase [Ktedonosporobacter rubrisoli]QBD77073.1 LLM class flavin-dependent oxidoreductase [Ktedonosporobacter rubrisoli]
MENKEIASTQGIEITKRQVRERVGLYVYASSTLAAIASIEQAEAAGVRQVWVAQITPDPEILTILMAAAARTTSVRMGTAIVPTYPRHPLALAQQALAVAELAPDRLRLGIGPSHRSNIEGMYGIPMKSPHGHLREYITVLRAALWEGKVAHQGNYYRVQATLPNAPRVPILVSALREGAFRLAGELADGVITWMCPASYLLEKGLPALQEGAAKSGRPRPPLVAHVMVALNRDRAEARAALRAQFDSGRFHGRLPFYANMFAEAGFPVASDGSWSDELIDNLVISGNEDEVTVRLSELLARGLDELFVMPIPGNDTESQARLARLIGQL